MPVIFDLAEVPRGRGGEGSIPAADLAEYADALNAGQPTGDGIHYPSEDEATKAGKAVQRAVAPVVPTIGVGLKVWSPSDNGTFVFALIKRKRRTSKDAGEA